MRTIKIALAEKEFAIEVCRNEEDLLDIKKLDDSVFSKHQGISNALLLAIFNQGGLLIYKINNQIVGESQVLFESTAGQSIKNKQTALFYGTAVLPEFRNRQIGKALAMAQEKIAFAGGKTKAILSVRPENGISLNMRLKLGFKVQHWLPDYYSIGNGRLLLEKPLSNNLITDSEKQQKATNIVSIRCGDKADHAARQKIAHYFSIGQKVTGYRLISKSEAILEFS